MEAFFWPIVQQKVKRSGTGYVYHSAAFWPYMHGCWQWQQLWVGKQAYAWRWHREIEGKRNSRGGENSCLTECNLHQVKSFTQDLGNNPTLENRLYSVKGRERNTKLTLVVYNATSKPLLAEGDFFFSPSTMSRLWHWTGIQQQKRHDCCYCWESADDCRVYTRESGTLSTWDRAPHHQGLACLHETRLELLANIAE